MSYYILYRYFKSNIDKQAIDKHFIKLCDIVSSTFIDNNVCKMVVYLLDSLVYHVQISTRTFHKLLYNF